MRAARAQATRPRDRRARDQPAAASIAGPLAAAVLAALKPDAAHAALVSPDLAMPRTPEVALRRSVPVVNPVLKDALAALEEAQYLFRIPQRKPFGAMAAKSASVRETLSDGGGALNGCPADRRDKCAELLAGLDAQLASLTDALASRTIDRADVALYNALELVSDLATEEAPGLPFDVPARYRDMPRLGGRAKARLTVRPSPGAKSVTLDLTLDGYGSPLTAGRMLWRMQRGEFDRVSLKRTSVALTATAAKAAVAPPPAVAEGDAPPESDPPSSRASLPPLPLEILVRGEFEPRYKSTIDVQEGDVPGLPLSVYGALAVPRSTENPSYSDDASFFVYLFDPQDAGLGGASFDEGQYSVFGYVTGGADEIRNFQEAVIERVEVLEGKDKLIVP